MYHVVPAVPVVTGVLAQIPAVTTVPFASTLLQSLLPLLFRLLFWFLCLVMFMQSQLASFVVSILKVSLVCLGR